MKEQIYSINFKGKKNIPEIISEHFISMISSNILIPGEKLPSELALSRQMNISRIAIRESMKILEAKGYIKSFGRDGKFVTTTPQFNIQHTFRDLLKNNTGNISLLFDVKQTIDREISEFVCKNATSDDIIYMSTFIQSIQTANLNELRFFYYSFFTAFFSSSKNIFFTHLAVEISRHIKDYFEHHSSEKVDSIMDEKCIFEHIRSIINHIENKNIPETKKHIDIHNNYIKNIFISNSKVDF